MARTTEEIAQAIIAEKNANPTLSGLDSPSQVAGWRLTVYLVAFAIHLLEVLFDTLRIEVNDIIERQRIGSEAWYVEQAYLFQYGDIPTIVEGKLVYPTINEANRIIKRASVVRQSNANAILKVATIDEITGEIRQLTTDEMAAFNGYVRMLMFAGSFINTRSLPADFLRIVGTVYYNPIYPIDDLKLRVEAAVKNWIANVPYDGVFRRSDMVDAVRNVEGVTDFVSTEFSGRPDSLGAVFQPDTRSYISQAGYAKIKDDEFPLLDAPSLTGTLSFSPETSLLI